MLIGPGSERGRGVRIGRSLLAVFSWAVMAFLALPSMIVIPLSFSSVSYYVFPPPALSLRWYQDFLGSSDWRYALTLSVVIGLVSMVLAMALGTLAAIALARSSFRGKTILYPALLSPLIVPTILIAISLYLWLVRFHIVGSPLAIALGHVVVATPFVVVVVTAALEGLDPNYARAALSLGAHPLVAFVRVTAPIIRPALLSAAFLAFLASFDELLIAYFLSGPDVWTLPIQMFRGLRVSGPSPTIAAVSSLLIVVALLALAIQSANPARRSGIAGSSR
jgi:putative spermidine/putrescine transport system permease protein